nr:MAG: hypothetical protein [Lokiarchaeota virus Ratatoskr Meg22_1012]
MNNMIKRAISVISGYFVSLPIFFFDLDPITQSLILMVFFILYYYALDRLFDYIENKRGDKK